MKPAHTQWDFGDLFSPKQTRKVWTVAEVTVKIKKLLEVQVGHVAVTGEITNFRAQSSGHLYFTIKDATAQLSCVLFRGEPGIDRNLLKDGQKVILEGDITVYEPRGQYQLRVMAVELCGVGALQAAFERLKQKLNAEGLFATERKRKLPPYPARIGVVTSPTGAAIRDIIHVAQRRNPSLEIVLAPCRVQGQGAGEEIAAAIRLLNEYAAKPTPGGLARPLDVILVTRGGGSLEDLWAFNEEVVARAIFNSAVPVVSAVGHEIDFTIGDFVSDVRAATPSAAAEILTEGVFSGQATIAGAQRRIFQLARRHWSDAADSLRQTAERLARCHPKRRLQEQSQRLDDLQNALAQRAHSALREASLRTSNVLLHFQRVKPGQTVQRFQERVRSLELALKASSATGLAASRNRFEQAESCLRLLSPVNVLERGYSITTDAATGNILRSAEEASTGQAIRTRLKRGTIESIVRRTERVERVERVERGA
jgi:exodeoxyribonuclease VII large subunit